MRLLFAILLFCSTAFGQTPIFSDGFESGDFSAWTNGGSLGSPNYTVNSDPAFVHSGSYSGCIHYNICGFGAPVPQPVMSTVTSGALPASTVYAQLTYVTAAGETTPGLQQAWGQPANKVIKIASPAAYSNGFLTATGYNVYASNTSNTETLQNAGGVGCASANGDGTCVLGTDWQEPDSGLVSGAARPTINKAVAPIAPVLSQVAGGALGARTYYAQITYVTGDGETWYSAESTLAIDANKLLSAASPSSSWPGGTGWNIYVSTVSGSETRQNGGTPITLGSAWTESVGGLVAGVALPTTMIGCGSAHQDKNRYFEAQVNSPTGYDHLFVRGYVYVKSPESGASKAIQRKLWFLAAQTFSDFSPILKLQNTYYPAVKYLLMEFVTQCGSSADCTQVTYPASIDTLEFDRWYCIENEVQLNTPGLSDGIVRVWVDGVLAISSTSVNIRGSKTTKTVRIQPGRQVDRQNFLPADEYRYWDDVVVSDSYIGPLGSGPGAQLSPVSVAFNDTNVGNTSADSPRIITLTNNGGATLNTSDISITGAHAADFAVDSTTCGSTLAVDDSCTVSVSFTPLALGLHTAAVTFTDDASDSPQSVSLSGTGTGAPPAPAVSLTESSLGFGALTVGSASDTQQITLYNSGDATLNITSIVASTTSAPTDPPGDFIIDSTTCGATLPAAASCQVNVSFTPVAGGSRTGRIRFTTDAASSPDDVSTSGTGQIVLTLRGGTFRISKSP